MVWQLWMARDSRIEAARDGGQVAVNNKKGTSAFEYIVNQLN